MRPRMLKLGTNLNSGWMYRVYQNPVAAAYSSLYFFIFLSPQFSSMKNFITLLRNCEAYKVETWVHTWTVGGCIVYSGIGLLLLIHPSISSFFFLSNFQTLKIFVTLFWGTVRATRLKLRYTHEQWVDVSYILVSSCHCLFIPLFIFLSLPFSQIKYFRHTFLRNSEDYEVETWYTHEQLEDVLCISETGCCCLSITLFVPFPFSPIFKNLKFSSCFSCELRLKLSIHMDSGCIMYTRFRLLLLIHPFISSFCFLSISKY